MPELIIDGSARRCTTVPDPTTSNALVLHTKPFTSRGQMWICHAWCHDLEFLCFRSIPSFHQSAPLHVFRGRHYLIVPYRSGRSGYGTIQTKPNAPLALQLMTLKLYYDARTVLMLVLVNHPAERSWPIHRGCWYSEK